jgi:hypothetical protein
LTLDLSKLLRDGNFRPGREWSGTLVWRITRTGQQVASIGYEALLGESSGRARLFYTLKNRDEKRHADYWVQLDTTSQPFGGLRWWFLCPKTQARARKLHLPPNAEIFASRRAYRLAYGSQREADHDRAIERALELRRRLGASDGIGDPVKKPKGMHWATFAREMQKLDAAEAQVEGYMQLFNRLVNH